MWEKEETFKARVRERHFARFAYRPDIEGIDFVVADRRLDKDMDRHFYWAESKRKPTPPEAMLAQLLLTCKKIIDRGDVHPPKFLGCFDNERITFIEFNELLDLFSASDVNWKTVPSDVHAPDHRKLRDKIGQRLAAAGTRVEFAFNDPGPLSEFIRGNFNSSGDLARIQVDRNNFVFVYNRWLDAVKPSIRYDWDDEENRIEGIRDADFYLADLLSENDKTLLEALHVQLDSSLYRVRMRHIKKLIQEQVGFEDKGAAHRTFWNRYRRPPDEEYWKYICDRRDLLAPRNVREVKGAYFTPRIWVEKAQACLAETLGADWQDEYYVWDCAAGTGNLLAGLLRPERIWASTLDQPDIGIVHSDIESGQCGLLKDHVFRFDFLNHDFANLPAGLKAVIDDPRKRKNLVVFINPPYAEATSAATVAGTGRNKPTVATAHQTGRKYKSFLGKAANEFFAHFMARVHEEIPGCVLATFSTLKYINSQNFSGFRERFKGERLGGFIVPANTFDNVRGSFPVGFVVWRLRGRSFPACVELEVATEEGGIKRFRSDSGASINQWIKEFDMARGEAVGYLANPAPDFQTTNMPYITTGRGERHFNYFAFNADNFLAGCVYFAVRLCIKPTWLNNRDQFLHPNDGCRKDAVFQNNCLAYALFHDQNKIQRADGVNHWIPFTESQAGVKTRPFASHFMTDYLAGKIKPAAPKTSGLLERENRSPAPRGPFAFGPEARVVFDAGRALWRHYHQTAPGKRGYDVNASYYDIRAHFQGRNAKGHMNPKSDDGVYQGLVADLREALGKLAREIQPGVYKYGFLR